MTQLSPEKSPKPLPHPPVNTENKHPSKKEDQLKAGSYFERKRRLQALKVARGLYYGLAGLFMGVEGWDSVKRHYEPTTYEGLDHQLEITGVIGAFFISFLLEENKAKTKLGKLGVNTLHWLMVIAPSLVIANTNEIAFHLTKNPEGPALLIGTLGSLELLAKYIKVPKKIENVGSSVFNSVQQTWQGEPNLTPDLSALFEKPQGGLRLDWIPGPEVKQQMRSRAQSAGFDLKFNDDHRTVDIYLLRSAVFKSTDDMAIGLRELCDLLREISLPNFMDLPLDWDKEFVEIPVVTGKADTQPMQAVKSGPTFAEALHKIVQPKPSRVPDESLEDTAPRPVVVVEPPIIEGDTTPHGVIVEPPVEADDTQHNEAVIIEKQPVQPAVVERFVPSDYELRILDVIKKVHKNFFEHNVANPSATLSEEMTAWIQYLNAEIKKDRASRGTYSDSEIQEYYKTHKVITPEPINSVVSKEFIEDAIDYLEDQKSSEITASPFEDISDSDFFEPLQKWPASPFEEAATESGDADSYNPIIARRGVFGSATGSEQESNLPQGGSESAFLRSAGTDVYQEPSIVVDQYAWEEEEEEEPVEEKIKPVRNRLQESLGKLRQNVLGRWGSFAQKESDPVDDFLDTVDPDNDFK